MVISLSFFIVLIFFLLPGLLFRRLYYYGEFSKQFAAGHNIISLLSLSVVPGIVNFALIYLLYNYVFSEFALLQLIDIIKDINDPDYRFADKNLDHVRSLGIDGIVPLVGSVYSSAIIFGVSFGRIIRFTRLDTLLKLFRYKNYWFYIFNGQCTRFKKLKHLKVRNKKHVFTKADILIDSEEKTLLYSGYVVDYELHDNDCKALSKVMLDNAERYHVVNGEVKPTPIPGEFFIVDCSSMININLTYVYKETINVLKTKWPVYIDGFFTTMYFITIPFFIFKAEKIQWDLYTYYFSLGWFVKILCYLLFVQILSLFNPFMVKKNQSTYTTKSIFFTKLGLALILFGLIYILQ